MLLFLSNYLEVELEFSIALAGDAFCGAQRPLMRLTSAAMRNITAA